MLRHSQAMVIDSYYIKVVMRKKSCRMQNKRERGIKMNVVIYARISVQAQEKFLNEQTEKLKEHAKKMGWTIVETFVDIGYSGRTIERPALQEMINFVKTHDVDKVMVFRMDRLSLSPRDTHYLIEDVFLKNNTDLFSLDENFDTAIPFNRVVLGVVGAFNQLECEQQQPKEGQNI
jgi:site-specific DNA recombinase